MIALGLLLVGAALGSALTIALVVPDLMREQR